MVTDDQAVAPPLAEAEAPAEALDVVVVECDEVEIEEAEEVADADVAAEAEGLKLYLSKRSSGYKGVYKDAGRYYAQLTRDGKRQELGKFDTAVEAAVAYARAVGPPVDELLCRNGCGRSFGMAMHRAVHERSCAKSDTAASSGAAAMDEATSSGAAAASEEGTVAARPKRAARFSEEAPAGTSEDEPLDWLVGRRVDVWWKTEDVWYAGVVTTFNPWEKLCRVEYDDGPRASILEPLASRTRPSRAV